MSRARSPSPSRAAGSSIPTSRCSPPTTRGSRAAGPRSRRLRVYGGRPFRLAAAPRPARPRRRRASGSPPPDATSSSASPRSRSSTPARRRPLLRLVLDAGAAGRRARRRSPSSARSRTGSRRSARAAQRLVSLLGRAGPRRGSCRAMKSTSYAVNMAAEAEAKARGADEAIFVDADGIVLEGPVTNIWWREGDVLADAVARARHPGRRDARGPARARRGSG